MTNKSVSAPSPWIVDIRELRLSKHFGPGQSAPLDVTAAAPVGIVEGSLAIADTEDVTVTGLLESVSEGVVVTATITARASGECARCLADIVFDLAPQAREMYAYPNSVTAETTDADEVPRIDDDRIDLTSLVHDELVLAMPVIALCSPDCLGLCAQCGIRLDDAGPDHGHEIIDPRWAGLQGLLDKNPSDDTGVTANNNNEEK